MADGHLISVMTAHDGQRAQAAAWATAHGIDPADVHRIELYYDGGIYARVHQWDKNEHGRLYCPHDHDHWAEPPVCEIAEREPYNVTIISAVGAQAITERMRAWADATRSTHRALAPLIAILRAHRKVMRTDYRRRQIARRRKEAR